MTHETDGSCVALFVDHQDRATPLPIVIDERMCSDTVIRATQLGPGVFLACDLRWLNGVNVWETKSYGQRRALLDELLEEFHSPDLTALLTYDEVPPLTPVRGWETYDDSPGTLGVFLPVQE